MTLDGHELDLGEELLLPLEGRLGCLLLLNLLLLLGRR